MSAVIKDNAPGKTLVSLRGLNKHYGDFTAVDNLDLEIQDGEFLTFLGSSGSGKSTTLSMLAGFETPSSGEILVDGQSLVNVPPHKRDIGMVFQRYSLFPHLNVRDNIAFPLAIRKLSTSETKKNGSTPCSSWYSWSSSPTASRRRCPAGNSSAWRLPGHWCTSHAFC